MTLLDPNLIPQTTDTKNRVLVIGAGIIGLLWTSLLHFKGLRQIWVSDLSKGRRDIAQSLGKFFTNLYFYWLAQQRPVEKRSQAIVLLFLKTIFLFLLF